MEVDYRGVRISAMEGDITKQKIDAVVNPANSKGVMGGGAALAMKEAGGEQIEKDAVANAPIRIGKAIATTGGKLPARYVFHAPTMVLPADKANAKAVDQAVSGALRLAVQMGVKSVAFPGMGTGVGGVPAEEAAAAMVNAAKFFLDITVGKIGPLKEILFVDTNADVAKALEAKVGELNKPAEPKPEPKSA